jgi:protein-S-isoprenylcysteine O-methyltransferase Ste14
LNYLVTFLWVILILYWIVSARSKKKKIREHSWWRIILVRVCLILVTLLVLRVAGFHKVFRHLHVEIIPSNPALRIIGVVLCAAGIGFAIWARRHLGRNWGMPMSLQQDHELVTTGPYRLVRHPIYSGILLAVLGSALAQSIVWFLPLVIWGIYFVYSAKVEERLMSQEFPRVYPAYQAKTKMLIPFLW